MTETDAPDWSPVLPPAIEDIERLARAAIAALPEAYRAAASQVALRVEDFAPDEILEEMDLNDPFELSGLYEGTPLTEASVMDQPQRPDVIWLFRRPILDEWADRGEVTLGDLVSHVLVHEIAHHFGWSDEEIAAIDRWWE
jgi:predicted Zn-dependent protease with MMP-like domain